MFMWCRGATRVCWKPWWSKCRYKNRTFTINFQSFFIFYRRNSPLVFHFVIIVLLITWNSLTLFRHPSLSSILLGRSSRLIRMSAQSWWMEILACQSTLASPCINSFEELKYEFVFTSPAMFHMSCWSYFDCFDKCFYSGCCVGYCFQDWFLGKGLLKFMHHHKISNFFRIFSRTSLNSYFEEIQYLFFCTKICINEIFYDKSTIQMRFSFNFDSYSEKSLKESLK